MITSSVTCRKVRQWKALYPLGLEQSQAKRDVTATVIVMSSDDVDVALESAVRNRTTWRVSSHMYNTILAVSHRVLAVRWHRPVKRTLSD